MSNHDHLSNIGLHPAYDPDPAVHVPVRVAALQKRITDAETAVDALVGLQGRTITVTIGRNVGLTPLDLTKWELFQSYVRSTVENLLAPDFFAVFHGRGEWGGEPEDSATFLAVQATTTTSEATLRSELSYLALRFGQEAIALTIGRTDLVEP